MSRTINIDVIYQVSLISLGIWEWLLPDQADSRTFCNSISTSYSLRKVLVFPPSPGKNLNHHVKMCLNLTSLSYRYTAKAKMGLASPSGPPQSITHTLRWWAVTKSCRAASEEEVSQMYQKSSPQWDLLRPGNFWPSSRPFNCNRDNWFTIDIFRDFIDKTFRFITIICHWWIFLACAGSKFNLARSWHFFIFNVFSCSYVFTLVFRFSIISVSVSPSSCSFNRPIRCTSDSEIWQEDPYRVILLILGLTCSPFSLVAWDGVV